MNRYENTKFIKVSNNKNACKDFYIDITTMKDPRIRISALKTQFKHYLKGEEYWKPLFHYFERDYSFYTMRRGSFQNYQEVKEFRNELYKSEWERMNNNNMEGFSDFLNDRI